MSCCNIQLLLADIVNNNNIHNNNNNNNNNVPIAVDCYKLAMELTVTES